MIQEKDASLIMQETVGKKLLAIRAFDYEDIPSGKFVIILCGIVEELLGYDDDRKEVISRQMEYRIIPFEWDWARFLYEHPHKVAGYGLTISNGDYNKPAHVLVNDELLDILVKFNDVPF